MLVLFWATVLLIVFLFSTVCFIGFLRIYDTEREISRKAHHREEKKDWNDCVVRAKHHLVGESWRDSDGKTEFVRELFGDKVPQYLWYEFNGLTAEETLEVRELLWPERKEWHLGHFGDLEGHQKLRIRNAEVFLPELKLKTGKVLPLEQIGYADWWDLVGDDKGGIFPNGIVVFSLKGFYPQREMAS